MPPLCALYSFSIGMQALCDVQLALLCLHSTCTYVSIYMHLSIVHVHRLSTYVHLTCTYIGTVS